MHNNDNIKDDYEEWKSQRSPLQDKSVYRYLKGR